MRIQLRHSCRAAMMTAVALAGFIAPGPAASQISKGSWEKPQVPVKSSAPPPKRGRRHVPPPPLHAPLLTIQWRVQKRLKGKVAQDTSASAVFYTQDQVRLAITPNQDGYLYIIRNTQGEDGELIFPDSRINNGENKVEKNKEYVVPGYCPGFPDPHDCWWTMVEPAGLEEVTAVFSRDAALGLPAQMIGAGGAVKKEDIRKLRGEAGRLTINETSFPQGIGAGRYVIWVQNTNPRENHKLIYTIRLAHKGQPVGLKQ